MTIQGAIFDMDGTLLDSMHVWKNFGREYLKGKGLVPRNDLRDTLAPLTLAQAAELFRDKFGVGDPVPVIERDVNKLVEEEYFHRVLPKDGVREMLEEFKSAGVKMCVATATDRYLVEAAFRRTGLEGYFDFILTCGEVGCGKGEPRVFELALQTLGTEKSGTFVFEDSLYAIRTAKECGFPVAAVRDRHAERHDAEIRALADVYLETVPCWRGLIELPG